MHRQTWDLCYLEGMRRRSVRLAFAAFSATLLALTARCGPTSSAPASPGKAVAAKPPVCSAATLGLEAGPLPRALRRDPAASSQRRGAVVLDVLPGGPAAAAGIRANDIVEQIGASKLSSDCDFDKAAFDLSCDPVQVVVRRGKDVLELALTPVEQEPFLDRTCQDAVASACMRQAWTLWRRNQGQDRDRAIELYEKACRAGSAQACADFGRHLAIDLKSRGPEAVAALERACELGSGAGCGHFGFLFATGTLVKRDDRRATPIYVKACDLGDALGCYNAGLMADDGRGVPKDASVAVARLGEACEMGSSTACTNLGFHYEHGHAVRKDPARAYALYQKGCAGTSCQPANLNGCLNVGRSYRDGIGIEKDGAQAAAVFDDVCHRTPDPADTNAAEAASRGCSLLGALALDGTGVAVNLQKGREFTELGCDRGDSFGCFNAATIYANGTGVPADPAKAASFFDRACQAGDGEGCHQLGLAYDKGKGVAHDRKKAAALFQKACQLGFQDACRKKTS